MRIFLLSSSQTRLDWFAKYYNILKLPTNNKITVIFDDRRGTSIDFSKYEFIDNVVNATEVIETVKFLFTDCKNFDNILNIYGVSLKLLIFLYANMKGISKSFMIDDDIFYLQPLDDIYETNDYMKKKEYLSSIKPSEQVYKCLSEIFSKDILDKINDNLINSGTIVYTYDVLNELEHDLRKMFNSDYVYSILLEKYMQNRNGRPIKGKMWMLEQYFYACHLLKIEQKLQKRVIDFKENVTLITVLPKTDKPVKLMKLKKCMHFLPMDKETMMKYHGKNIDLWMEKTRDDRYS